MDVEYLIHLYKLQKEALDRTRKLDWHDQDIKRLIEITFNVHSHFAEYDRTISKAQEDEILIKFNKVVEEISEHEKINPTLFFSKKSQKEFLRIILVEGLDSACRKITSWRGKLIKEELLKILK